MKHARRMRIKLQIWSNVKNIWSICTCKADSSEVKYTHGKGSCHVGSWKCWGYKYSIVIWKLQNAEILDGCFAFIICDLSKPIWNCKILFWSFVFILLFILVQPDNQEIRNQTQIPAPLFLFPAYYQICRRRCNKPANVSNCCNIEQLKTCWNLRVGNKGGNFYNYSEKKLILTLLYPSSKHP